MDKLPSNYLYGKIQKKTKFQIGVLTRKEYSTFMKLNNFSYDEKLHICYVRKKMLNEVSFSNLYNLLYYKNFPDSDFN